MNTTNSIATTNSAVFISRMQPAHMGHLSALKQAVAQGVTNIIIGIGSADKEMTPDNPFTYDQRKPFAEAIIAELQKEFPDITGSVHPLMDVGDNAQWKKNLQSSLPPFDTIITGNPIVQDIFGDEVKVFIPDHTTIPYRGTHIRHQIMYEDRETIKLSVPQSIIDKLQAMGASSILKNINTMQPRLPQLATDLIVVQEGKFVCIKRKFAPYGLALAGGMLDSGETLQECAKREGGEELFDKNDGEKNFEITTKQPLWIHDDPLRDPRGRVISFVYEGVVKGGTLCASDDADSEAGIQYINPDDLETIPDSEFAFYDHKLSLIRYRDRFMKNA